MVEDSGQTITEYQSQNLYRALTIVGGLIDDAPNNDKKLDKYWDIYDLIKLTIEHHNPTTDEHGGN